MIAARDDFAIFLVTHADPNFEDFLMQAYVNLALWKLDGIAK
jgi:hypothetical protein